MTNIELVIRIPEEKYKTICEMYGTFPKEMKDWGLEAIKNGVPLPKGHGALKDFEKIYVNMTGKEELARQRVMDTSATSHCYMRYVTQLNERIAFKEMLNDSPIIIKANEE